MAGEEIFTASAIYTFVVVGVFLAFYLVNRHEKNHESMVFANAALTGVFAGLVVGARVMLRAFTVIDPTGGIDIILLGALNVLLWLLIISVIVVFFRLILSAFHYIKLAVAGKWESYGHESNKSR